MSEPSFCPVCGDFCVGKFCSASCENQYYDEKDVWMDDQERQAEEEEALRRDHQFSMQYPFGGTNEE